MEEIPMTNPLIEETVAIAMGEKPFKAKEPKKRINSAIRTLGYGTS
jgi:hypothetical protein